MKQSNHNYQDRELAKVSQWDAAKYYFSIMWRWKGSSLSPFILTGLGSLFVIFIPPLFVAEVLDRLATGVSASDTMPLLGLVGLIAGSMLFGELLWRFGTDLMSRFQSRAMSYIAEDTFKHLLNKTLRFHADTFAGALVTKATRLSYNIVQFHDTLIFNINWTVASFIIVGAILIPRAPLVYVIFLLICTLFVLTVRKPIQKRSKLVKKRTRAESAQTAALADALSNIAAIKSFAREDFEQKLYRTVVKKRHDLTLRSWLFQVWRIDTIISPMVVAVNVASLAGAVIAVTRYQASLDLVFLSYTYISQLSRNMWEFNRVWRNLETQLSEAANGLEVIRAGVELTDNETATQTLESPRGIVSFRGVGFQYHDGRKHLFDKLNLDIKPGEKVGLVGPSGGGKTTIVKLLLRFNDVTSGSVEIDGVDVRDMTQAELRKHLAYVPQEPALFHRTIADNIRYGDLEASDKAVERAARLAHAEEFIDHLPNGYNTLVGERGVKLSGGQRQRIALARAMLRQSPILVLDEATSALDSKSEKLIAQALDNLMKGRTTIVIAHRLSTIRRLDRIIVIDKGKIVEEGTHDELLGQKGKYHELWSHQSGDFL